MKIAIASGKGGTGKTTISSNLASFLSLEENIVLTDLDVEEPNSGLFIKGKTVNKEDQFKMIPEWKQNECILCGNCQEVCNFHAVIQLGPQILVFPELCHSCYACSELCPTNSLPMKKKKMGELKEIKKGKLSFIESRLVIGEEQAVPLIHNTIKYVDEKFGKDIIKIFDAPPGTSCPVIEATKDADFILLITEPTPFGLHDLKLAVETMKEIKKEFGVIINRSRADSDIIENYCADEKITIIAKIPESRKIAELYSSGELLYDKMEEVEIELIKIKGFINTLKKNN